VGRHQPLTDLSDVRLRAVAKDLVAEIRQNAVGTLHADRKLSIEDVAVLLGYADPTGLRRAYRRWFGRELSRSPARPYPPAGHGRE
jgi:transcriptional regulator GlxA family with amidase domain